MSDKKCTCGIIPEDTQGIVHRGEYVVPSNHPLIDGVTISVHRKPMDDDVIMSLGITARELKDSIKDTLCDGTSEHQQRVARAPD